MEGITIGISGVLTVGGVDTVQPAEGGVSNNCASFGTCIAVVVGKSVVRAGENVCNQVLPLGPSANAQLSTDIRSVDHICEQRRATSVPYGSDLSLKPVTSD